MKVGRPLSLVATHTTMAELRTTTLAALVLGLLAGACGKGLSDVGLSKSEPVQAPDVPVPAANGPKLGATAHATPVRERPDKEARIIGYLHAGSRVARAEDPYSREGCTEGWYPIRPKGFVCAGEGATTDLHHPTLTTMAIQPQLDAALPYTYARTTADGTLYAVDENGERKVKAIARIPSRSGLAVVGSWQAQNEEGTELSLAMLTNGQFVETKLLQPAKTTEFSGIALKSAKDLPVAFVLKRGVYSWELKGAALKRQDALEFHQTLHLTGRFRDVLDQRYWEQSDGTWVRHRDVTVLRARDKFPQFVHATRRWIDVSVITGALVAYEGQVPVYATLVSVGRDRLGETEGAESVTQRGEFQVVAKHLTLLNAQVRSFANRVDIYDTPWALELSSGQFVHGSYWHRRIGIEHGPGNLQLSPADARWLWQWVSPAVPDGWHAVTDPGSEDERTIVNVRR